jgi:hypothetical protein
MRRADTAETSVYDSSMAFEKGNAHGRRFQPGQSGNPGGRSALQRRFEDLFFSALYNDRLRQQAMAALKKAIQAGEGWAIKFYFEKALPTEPLRIEVAPDLSKLRDVILEACADHPEVRFKIARRLLEIGQAIDTPFEQVQ